VTTSKQGRLLIACLLAFGVLAAVSARGQTLLTMPLRPVPFRALPPLEREQMIEVTDDGLRLPRISPSGWMPWMAYARRFEPTAGTPRIGILMINLGADAALTRRAIDELPGRVSLAFLPGSPDLARWLQRAHEHGHETYLMLPTDDPNVLPERGLRPIQVSLDAEENLARLHSVMARGEGYVGFVMISSDGARHSETTLRPLLKEMAERGLGLVEVNPAPATPLAHHLTAELGMGYAHTAEVLDYKLADGGLLANLDRLESWASEPTADRPPRHRFGVVQPEADSIEAIGAWARGRGERPAAFVPVIAHFECRDACLARLRVQPAQLQP
jgi:polysaccharide deacetylase 2 family uncharacterized protein YibQ